ncbi:hypothetical protein [Agromyces ramosus]|uniref:Uncharacterized protein n=1 Tax=Agromyces ramosus TaxID=33879 RepID=A0ABU0R8R2_9MICO|nr:hypothetical protein [Agromyces ramosus]MDQ0894464.1 hypothetical protein [Agromyces ramosus]
MNITLSPDGIPIIDLELGDLAGPAPAGFTAAVDQLAEKATVHSFTRVGHAASIESVCACGDSFESEGRDGAARAAVMSWELEHKAGTS